MSAVGSQAQVALALSLSVFHPQTVRHTTHADWPEKRPGNHANLRLRADLTVETRHSDLPMKIRQEVPAPSPRNPQTLGEGRFQPPRTAHRQAPCGLSPV